MKKLSRTILITIGALALVFFVSSFYFSSHVSYSDSDNLAQTVEAVQEQPKEVKHIKTPEPLKAVYMTACVAGTPSLREKVVNLIDETELNAIVIDIKDYSGTISFATDNPKVDSVGGTGKGCKVSDMKEFVEELHDKDIYVIGRLTAFQDQIYTKVYPDSAVKKANGVDIWKDRKGLSFVDVGYQPFWDYLLDISKSSYAIGFDEINFDYIRFPSDGDMKDIAFTHTGAVIKKEMLRKFFEYLDLNLHNTGIVTSADIFGMTTTNTDDLGIGQVLEYALQNFDYVAPMVYPSHYPPNFHNYPDPNKVPYEIVNFSMSTAVNRTNLLYKEIATSTPDAVVLKRINPLQLRPWLQDNDYPVHYTADMIRAQIKATYDAGLTSWMLWDPANTYTEAALLKN